MGVAGLAAEHMTVDPEIAGLLLRQGVEDATRTQCAQECIGIRTSGMVALTSTAIKGDALAPMFVDEAPHPLGDFPDRHVPFDFVKAPVGTTTQRGLEAVLVVGIEGNTRRLVAEIAV
jgi:hypothetical protein